MNRRRFLSKTLGALGGAALAALATTKRRPDRLQLATAEAARRGYSIETVEFLPPTGSYAVHQRRRIVVSANDSPDEQARAIAYHLADGDTEGAKERNGRALLESLAVA